MDAILKNAPHVAFQFSGGRDSLAALILLRPWWDCMTVYYVNSGDPYPETLGLVALVAAAVPHFVEIKGIQPEVVVADGWPSDVLPAGHDWPWPEHFKKHLPLSDRHKCCWKSIMFPLHERMRDDGIKVIIRGQRASDWPKAGIRDGSRDERGITYLLPIEHWSDQQIQSLILSSDFPMPPFYAAGMTSTPDCMHCTAWLEHGALPFLRSRYPAVATEVDSRLIRIQQAVRSPVATLSLTVASNPNPSEN